MAGKIRVTQIRSPIGRDGRQRTNLIGLGLNKISRSRVLLDIPAVRGRIAQVHHLVRVELVEQTGQKTKPARAEKVKAGEPETVQAERPEKVQAEQPEKAKVGR